MMALAADIGGTYSRLTWTWHDSAAAEQEQHFQNADFDNLEAVLAHGLALIGAQDQRIDRMVLAVPGPVDCDPVILTNIDWQLDRKALQRRFGTTRLQIVNDFQAAAIGAITEPAERLLALNPAAAQRDNGPAVVTGAGTGLGMAWLARRDQTDLPFATEGGHLDFAPTDATQLRLYQQLVSRHGHVSYERLLSGDGLLQSYRLLAEGAQCADSPAQIAALAQQGDADASAAVRLFVDVFAAYAGNLALAFNPSGGVYLCGGLAVHLADWFEPDAFVRRFADKGRMRGVVERIPVFLVRRHDAGLAGARDLLKRSTGQSNEQQ